MAVLIVARIRSLNPTRHTRRVFALCGLLTLAGCHVAPWRVPPTPTMKSYADLDCPALDTEARRLETLIATTARSHHSGTRDKLSVMRGQANAVNEQISRKGCGVPMVDLQLSRKHRRERLPTAVSY
jgi:hypothetical protein